MIHRILICVSALLAVVAAGCGNSAKTAIASPEVLLHSDAPELMAAAQDTLGQMHFILDKYDVEAGYIRTRPLRASQFFEPWRQDNASATAFAQANMNSLRRTVEVFVEPQEGATALRCVVTVEQLSLPPQPIRSMSRLAEMYTDSSQSVQTLALGDEQAAQMEWFNSGPDHALEHRIVSRIQKHLRKG